MSRLLLDTTYLLPAVGVKLGGELDRTLVAAQDAGHEVWISDITVFELLAKGAKLVEAGKLSEERLALGVRGILADGSIRKASAYEEDVAETSVKLRRYHRDFVDCLIVASALEHCDGLVTEEEFEDEPDLVRFIEEMSPSFRVLKAKELARKG